MVKYHHVTRCHSYARKHAKGGKYTCEYVRLACLRHVEDLAASKDTGYPFEFDRDLAERACQFIELLPHVKGRWASQRKLIELEDWQRFIICNLFGWLRRDTGLRKYNHAYIEVSRKNGKSVLAAGIGLYMFAADNEFGSEVYSGATTEKQSWEVFRPARLMAARGTGFTERFGVGIQAKTMTIDEDGSRFECMIGKPGDGASPHCAIIDEYHEHKTPDMYETMVTGMGARDQPLCLVITTAGANLMGPCYEMRADLLKVLTKASPGDNVFGMVYTIDDESEWTTKTGMRKANPNLGISVSEQFLEQQVEAAMRSPTKQSAVKTKHFNCWVGAYDVWLNMESWLKCGDPTITQERLKALPCYIGLDLATRLDIAAAVMTFVDRDEEGRLLYYCFPKFWLPASAASHAANSQRYTGWASDKLITLCPGDEIEMQSIQEWLIGVDGNGGIQNEYDIREVVVDPWQATQLAQTVDRFGMQTVELRNTIQHMSPAMLEMEAAVLSGRFIFDGNPILTWMASNTIAWRDNKDNLMPRKENPEQKIDGVVAAIMSINRAMGSDEHTSAYDNEALFLI